MKMNKKLLSQLLVITMLTMLMLSISDISNAAATRSFYMQTEAESYDQVVGSVSAIRDTVDPNATDNRATVVSQFGDDAAPEALVFKNVYFDGAANSLDIRLRADNTAFSVNLEIRVNSMDGPLAGSINATNVSNTVFSNVTCKIDHSVANGLKDVYLISRTNIRVNWFRAYKARLLEAENYAQVVVGTVKTQLDDTNSSQALAQFGSNGTAETVKYQAVDFGDKGVTRFEVRCYPNVKNVYLELRVDSPNNAIAGSISIPDPNMVKQEWNSLACDITGQGGGVTGLTGVHDLYLTSKQDISINWMKFHETRSAYEQVEAEDYEWTYGAFNILSNADTTDANNNNCVGLLGDTTGEIIAFRQMRFDQGGSRKLSIRAINNNGTAPSVCTVDIKLDNKDAPSVGNVVIPVTSVYGTYDSAEILPAGITGVHDVFLLVSRCSGISINWIKFMPYYTNPPSNYILGDIAKQSNVVTVSADVYRSWIGTNLPDTISVILAGYDENNVMKKVAITPLAASDILFDPSKPYGNARVNVTLNAADLPGNMMFKAYIWDNVLSGKRLVEGKQLTVRQ